MAGLASTCATTGVLTAVFTVITKSSGSSTNEQIEIMSACVESVVSLNT